MKIFILPEKIALIEINRLARQPVMCRLSAD